MLGSGGAPPHAARIERPVSALIVQTPHLPIRAMDADPEIANPPRVSLVGQWLTRGA